MSDREQSDVEAFRAAMGDVKRIKVQPRVRPSGGSAEERFNSLERRRAALSDGAPDRNSLSGDFIEQLDPHDLLDFKRPGVQNGVFRNLRLGKYSIDARLDLHNHTVEQARRALYSFIKDCMTHDIRCALITHGKGELRKNPALLKSCIAHWLPQLEEILAFHSAQKHHGGSGATYVMLRKSEHKRRDNLERHQKRSS